MPAIAFFDTNVLLYALSQDDPRKGRARSLLSAGGVISVQVMNEFVSVARRKMRKSWPEITEAMEAIRIVFPNPVALTVETHQKAVTLAQQYGIDIYDALIVASALEESCDVLYTEDLQDGQKIESQLTIRNPFKFNDVV